MLIARQEWIHPTPIFPNFFSSYDVFSSDAVTPLFPPNMFTRQGLKMSKCASWPKHASTCSTDRTIITTIQVNARGEHTPKPIKNFNHKHNRFERNKSSEHSKCHSHHFTALSVMNWWSSVKSWLTRFNVQFQPLQSHFRIYQNLSKVASPPKCW